MVLSRTRMSGRRQPLIVAAAQGGATSVGYLKDLVMMQRDAYEMDR